jgi:hypothetical protein
MNQLTETLDLIRELPQDEYEKSLPDFIYKIKRLISDEISEKVLEVLPIKAD